MDSPRKTVACYTLDFAAGILNLNNVPSERVQANIRENEEAMAHLRRVSESDHYGREPAETLLSRLQN